MSLCIVAKMDESSTYFAVNPDVLSVLDGEEVWAFLVAQGKS